MNDLKYSVLFTHQKAKKAKIWRDGTLKILTFGTKAVLYDDIGSKLDVLHLHSKDVQSGEQFETDRYLILVEEKVVYQSPISNQSDQSVFTNANTCHCSTLVSCSNTDVIASSSTLASEIKRKQCGFIPPRSVEQHSGASNNLPISPVFTSHSLNKHAAIESGNISGQPPFLNSQHLDKGTLLYEQKKDFTSNCFDKSTIIVGDANDEYTTAQSSLVDMKSTFRCLSTSCQHPSESHSLLKTAICKVNSSSMHDGPSLFNNFCNPNVKRQCLELHASGQGTPLNYLRTTTVEQDVDVGSHEKQNVLPHARKSLDHLTCCGSKKMYAENSTGIIGSVQLGLSRPVVRRSCNDILSLLSQKNDFKFPVSANWESKVTSAINENGFSMLNMAVISGESSGVANNFMERECLEDTVSQNEGRFDSRQFSKALLMDSSLDWLLPNVAEKDADCDKHAASPVQAVPAAEGCKFVSHNHSNHIHLLNCCKDQTNTKMTMYCNAMAFMNEITSVDNIAQPVLGNTHLTDISVKAPDVTYSMCTLLPLATDFLASSSLPVPLLPDQLSPLSSQGISLNCMLGSMDAGSNNNVIDSTCGVVYGKRTQMLNTGDDVKISCFVCEASQNIDNLEDRASFSVPDSYSIANSTNNDLLNESVTPVINLNGNDVTFLLDLSPVSADPQSGKDNLECTFDQSDDKSFRKDCEPMSECCLHSIENFSSDASYVGDQRSVAHNDTKNGQNLPTVDKAHEAKGCEQPSNQDAFVNVASQVFFGVFQQDGNDSGCPALYSVPSNRSLATENAAALDASLLANDNEDVMSFSSSVEENYLCSQHKLPSLNSSEVMHNLVSSTLHNIKTLDDLCISPDDLSPHQHTVVSSCSGIDYGQNGHMAMCGLENTEQCRNNDGATGFSRHQVNMSLSDDIVLDAAASFSNADVHSVLTSELIDGICSQSQIDVACTTSDIDTAIVSLSVFPTAEPLPFTASMTAIHSENGKIYCERTMSPVFHHKRICPVVSEVFSNKFPKLSSHTDFTENVSHEHNQVHIQSTVSQETNCVSQMFPSAVFSIVPDNITGDNLNVVMSGSDNEATNAMKETGSVFIDGEHENKSFNEILYSDELCDKVSLSNLSFSNEYFSYSDIKVKKNHSKPLLVQCFTKPPTGSMENSVCLNPSIDDIGYTCCRTSLDNKCFTRMLCTHSESPFNSSMSNRKMCSEDGITELWSPAVCVTCMKPSAVEHDLLHNAMVKLRSYQMSGTVCGKLVHYSSAPTCNPQCDIFSKHSDCDTDVMSSLDCSEMLTAAKTDSSSICSDEFRHRGLDLLNDFSLSESYFCSPESAFKWNDTSVKYNSGMFSIALNEDASKKFSDRFTSQHLSEESLCSQNCSQPLRCASCCHNIDIDDGLIKDRKAIIKKFPLLCQQVIDVTPIATESHSCVDVRMRHFDVDRAHFPGRMTEGCKTVLSNDLSPQLYSQIDDVMTINGGLCLDDNALTPFCNLTGSEVNVSLIENTNRQFVNQVNCQTNHLHIPDIVNNNGYGNGMNEVTTCSVDIFGLAGLEYEKDHTVVKESNFSTSEFSGFDDSFSESVSNNVEQDICVRHTKNCNDMLHVPVEKNCLSSVYISNGNGQMLFKDIDQESFVSNNTLFSDKHASSFVSNSILDSAEDSCMSNAECVTPHVGEVMLSTEIKATIKWKRASKCFQSLNSVNSLLDVLPTSVHILPTQMLHEGILKLTECELDDFLVPSAVIDSPPLDICCQSNLEDLLMSNNVMSPATNLAAELIQCIPVSNSLNAPRNELKSVEVKSFDFSQDIPLVYISNDLSPSVSESHNNNEIRLCTGTPGTLQGFKPPTQIDPSITKKYYDQADKDYTCSDGWSYSEFKFPGKLDVDVNHAPLRRLTIPITFNSPASYRNVLLAALTEYLNIQLFEIARTYHLALEKVDINSFIDDVLFVRGKMRSAELLCKCGIAAKVLQVRKEGPNKGRFFYACSIPREKQCRFFKWVDKHHDVTSGTSGSLSNTLCPKINDSQQIMEYFRSSSLSLFCHCQYIRRSEDCKQKQRVFARKKRLYSEDVDRKCMFIKISRIFSDSHAKGDMWAISKSLLFAPNETFLAQSTFHAPSTRGEVAIEPLSGYRASSWSDGEQCHAILCLNAGTELACLSNILQHVTLTSMPLLPCFLNSQSSSDNEKRTSGAAKSSYQRPCVSQSTIRLFVPGDILDNLADEFIVRFSLNADQASTLKRVAVMMNKDVQSSSSSILLIRGVFGSGKSFLLSVMILFLVELFHQNDRYSVGVSFPWKLLLAATTNVAVDRVLESLLSFGFEDLVRVGSVRKIAKPLLPFSLHCSGSESQELRELQEMLKGQNITASEKYYVRKCIERQKLGENRKRLGAVRVVGVTCAACSFSCLDRMRFPFVVLDECSQMTEPSSLLAIARFHCERLVLLGDPKQLTPTMQGPAGVHNEGLEQTLFDRFLKMGRDVVLLHTQYRCHPKISAVANSLFYEHQLFDGVSDEDRAPMLDFLPTICFYDIASGQEEPGPGGSFVNRSEAEFVSLLLTVLVDSGIQTKSLGVVALYRAQAQHIRELLDNGRPGADKMSGVHISTVDAFQGGENDIIILSCVRTHSVGFIDNEKRMNVAVTRARHHLLLAGHLQNLNSSWRWSQVIDHCHRAGEVVSERSATKQLQSRKITQ